jgi:hypothetical protein
MLHIVLVLLLIPVPGCFPTKLCYTNGGPALLHKLAARSKQPAASRQSPQFFDMVFIWQPLSKRLNHLVINRLNTASKCPTILFLRLVPDARIDSSMLAL